MDIIFQKNTEMKCIPYQISICFRLYLTFWPLPYPYQHIYNRTILDLHGKSQNVKYKRKQIDIWHGLHFISVFFWKMTCIAMHFAFKTEQIYSLSLSLSFKWNAKRWCLKTTDDPINMLLSKHESFITRYLCTNSTALFLQNA